MTRKICFHWDANNHNLKYIQLCPILTKEFCRDMFCLVAVGIHYRAEVEQASSCQKIAGSNHVSGS